MSEVKEDFWIRYSNNCIRDKLCPLKYVMRHFKGTELCCPVEAIRREHWFHLLSALSIDNSLTKIHLASCVSPHDDEEDIKFKRNRRDKGFPTPYGRSEGNIKHICISLSALLHSSHTLVILKLENLSIKIYDADQLSVGIAESCGLKYLSLAGCQFECGSVEVICNGIKRSRVSWLDLSSCALIPPDITAICDLIKSHAVKRSNEMFPETLRYNFPDLEDFHGLNRLSLNYNYIEDEGLFLLIESMVNDLWMKALDLQNCGIEDDAAMGLLSLACSNTSLEIIDIRLNDVDENILCRIAEQLTLNKAGKRQPNYSGLSLTNSLSSLWKPSDMIRRYNAISKGKCPKRASVYKFRIIRKASKSFNYSVKSSSIVRRTNNMKNVSVQTSKEPFIEIPEKVQALMNEMRLRLNNEMKLRKFFMTKYRQLKVENVQLKEFMKCQNDDIYIDQETYFDIKHTFEKLKIFFDVMKKYGLWEYISMLGFDETTDVVIKENDTMKSVKVIRKDTPMYIDEIEENKVRAEPCCNCRKLDLKHSHTESLSDHLPDETQNCANATSTKTVHNKGKIAKVEDPLKENDPYQLLQNVMNDYNNATSHQVHNTKSMPGKMTNSPSVPQDNTKPSSSKQSGSVSPKTNAGAHMLIKKFSYSNMPKKLKELVSPADFYSIVKKELERCESEASKALTSAHIQTTAVTQTTSHMAKIKVHTQISLPHRAEEMVAPTIHQQKESSSKVSSEATNDDDFENITISELIAMERAAKQKQASSKYIPTKKESAKSSVSSSSSSKIHKNTNAKIKETKSLIKSEQMLPKSKLKHSSSCQTSSQSSNKKVQARPNVSSDEINSSDSIVTASDKLSGSSTSSSSSNKTPVKTSSGHNESEHQKSYIESVSDASTFKDVESISDTEVVSQGLSHGGGEKVDSGPNNKSVSVAKTTKDDSGSSHSSTLKDALKSKSIKPDEPALSGTSVKDTSSKSDKSIKTNVSTQGKIKNANKQYSKNRPKSNSSKSSSVPSLSDITTVSSQSLNTDSVMKQIPGSEGSSKGEN